jgi:hypothetical protein
VALVLLASACGSSDSDTENGSAGVAPAASDGLVVENQGGSMEGHTPRGFAGSGTGLFVGDNLNPGFPDGDGVQAFLTFDIGGTGDVPAGAVLRSRVMSVEGDPFADLGALSAEPVIYDAFGRDLFDLAASGPAVVCEVDSTGIECDVTAALQSAVESGQPRAQFRVKFDRAGDSDGEPDLALFFLTDSNTNEPGIFTLELS